MSKQTTLTKSQTIEEEQDDFDEEEIEFDDGEEDKLESISKAFKEMITTFYRTNMNSSEKDQIYLGSDNNIGVEAKTSKSSFSKYPRTKIGKISTQHLLQLLSAMDIYRNTDSIEDYLIFSTIPNKNCKDFPLLCIESKDCRGYIVPRTD